MKIRWLGHASFLITSDAGVRIITDPYTTNDKIKYGQIKESADIVTVSHEHGDHSNSATVAGKPVVVKGAGSQEIKGIKITGISVFHDPNTGKDRGKNTIFCLDIDGSRVCHLGDLGHLLSDKEVAQIGKVDVLMIPVGGFYTIDAKEASQVMDKIAPKITMPMHYKNEKCDYPIAGVDVFVQGKTGVVRKDGSDLDYKKGGSSAGSQIVVLNPAL